MKKIFALLFCLSMLVSCDSVFAQDFYKLNKNKAVKGTYKSQAPNVAVTVQPSKFSQLNFITGFDQVTINSGVWSANATSFSFTPSLTLGSANATVTVTSSGDTLYHLSQVLAYGAGLTVWDNVAIGKVDIAPTLIFQVGQFALIGGYGINGKQVI